MKYQKKVILTACLLATLSFNLSHLFSGAITGQADLASNGDLVAPAAATEGGVTGLVTAVEPAGKAPSEKAKPKPTSLSHKGKVTVGDSEVDATIVDINGKATFVIDRDLDPRKSICASCANGVFTSDINYTSAIEDLKGSMTEAEKIIRASSPTKTVKGKKEVEVDLASIPVDEMTDQQKEKRADELLTTLEDSCGEIEKDESALKCYTRGLKSMLRDSDNKKIFKKNEDKVDEFISENVKEKITSALAGSKFSESTADQIEKLHEALPGKFESSRTLIIEASADAAKKAATNIQAKQQIVDRAKVRFEGSKTPEEQNRNGNAWNRQAYELQQMKVELGPKVTDLLEKKNDLGLASAVSHNYMAEDLRDQLMDHYDDLTAQLFDSNSNSSSSSSVGSNGNLVPTKRQFSESNNNGVHRLNLGQPLQSSGDAMPNNQNTNNSRGSFDNRPSAPGSFNNTLQQQQSQNNGSFNRPPAPQLTPSTSSLAPSNFQNNF